MASGTVAPNVWTGCPSQVRGCCQKSLICIRPVDRRAGRGLDGNTQVPLISSADRLSSSHSGHQIQGASIDPFHAAPQLRTRSRRRLNRRGLKVAIEGFAVAQDAPSDPGELVGQGNGKFVLVQSARRSCEPSTEAIPGPIMRAHQEDLRRLINSVRRYLLPRLEMRPRMDRPPVLCCRGTRPSQAPKSRPRSKASPVLIAATMPAEISGPIREGNLPIEPQPDDMTNLLADIDADDRQ